MLGLGIAQQCKKSGYFYPQINGFVQINCRHGRKPTLSLFDVSTNDYWIVYKMELWLWTSKIHASTDQNKFGDIQLLDIMNFLGSATSLDSFLKAYKTKETKGFFPYEWHSLAFCAIATALKNITMLFKTLLTVV